MIRKHCVGYSRCSDQEAKTSCGVYCGIGKKEGQRIKLFSERCEYMYVHVYMCVYVYISVYMCV